MNCFEAYLVELLQGRITYNEHPVEVRRQFSIEQNLPCITINTTNIDTEYHFHEIDVDDNLWIRYNASINLNLWCNTEEEREQITEDIMECFYKELSYNHQFCSKYNDGLCEDKGTCNYTYNDKCSDPIEYGYMSLREKHYIVEGSVVVNPPFTLDEYDRHPPLLRNVFQCRCSYEKPAWTLDTMLLQDVLFDDENL